MSNATVTQKSKAEIKVIITVPEKVNEVIKQQKINRIYDLLKPKK